MLQACNKPLPKSAQILQRLNSSSRSMRLSLCKNSLQFSSSRVQISTWSLTISLRSSSKVSMTTSSAVIFRRMNWSAEGAWRCNRNSLQRVDHLAEVLVPMVIQVNNQCSQFSSSQLSQGSKCTGTARQWCHNHNLTSRWAVDRHTRDTVLLKACHKPRLLANSRLRSKCTATVPLCKDSQGSSLLTTHTAHLPSEVAARQPEIEMKERQRKKQGFKVIVYISWIKWYAFLYVMFAS